MHKYILYCLIIILCIIPIWWAIFDEDCQVHWDCFLDNNEHYRCHDEECERKPFTFWTKEIIGFGFIFLLSWVTNSGGVGAGSIMVPVFIYLFSFTSSDAIPLSRITIFAGWFVNFLLNWNDRHWKKKNKFLINYEIAAVIMPLLLAGTQVGVIIATFLPASTVAACLLFYLISSAKKMYAKAVKDSAHEDAINNQELEKLNEVEVIEVRRKLSNEIMSTPDPANKLTEPISPVKNDKAAFEMQHDMSLIQVNQDEEERRSDLSLLKGQIGNFLFIIFAFCCIAASAMLRGGRGRGSIIGVVTCGGYSWLIFGITQLFCIVLSILAYKMNRKILLGIHSEADEAKESVQRKTKSTKELITYSFVAGILAGTLGVGGGMVLGLQMLALGMDTEATTALWTFIVFVWSGSTTIQFYIAGAIHMKHAVLFTLFSFLGWLGGNLILRALIRKFKKPSIIVWTLFVVLILATIVLPIDIIEQIIKVPSWAYTFGKFC